VDGQVHQVQGGPGAREPSLLRQVHKAAEHPAPETASATGTAVPEPPASLNGHADRAAEIFAEDLAAGTVPGVRRIRREMHVGQPKAQELRMYLTARSEQRAPGR
jgi:hypothetical protein